MTKQDVIQKFIEACADSQNYSERKLAVESQYNRKTWEIYHKDGLIRITTSPVYQIMIWPVLGRQEAPAGERVSARSFQLFEDEYLSLKATYFGRFQPDEKYLAKLRAGYYKKENKKVVLNLIYAPLGTGFTLLLLYACGAVPLTGTLIFFGCTIVLWLGHELYKKLRNDRGTIKKNKA